MAHVGVIGLPGLVKLADWYVEVISPQNCRRSVIKASTSASAPWTSSFVFCRPTADDQAVVGEDLVQKSIHTWVI